MRLKVPFDVVPGILRGAWWAGAHAMVAFAIWRRETHRSIDPTAPRRSGPPYKELRSAQMLPEGQSHGRHAAIAIAPPFFGPWIDPQLRFQDGSNLFDQLVRVRLGSQDERRAVARLACRLGQLQLPRTGNPYLKLKGARPNHIPAIKRGFGNRFTREQDGGARSNALDDRLGRCSEYVCVDLGVLRILEHQIAIRRRADHKRGRVNATESVACRTAKNPQIDTQEIRLRIVPSRMPKAGARLLQLMD